jgi:hypothetical protein
MRTCSALFRQNVYKIFFDNLAKCLRFLFKMKRIFIISLQVAVQ